MPSNLHDHIHRTPPRHRFSVSAKIPHNQRRGKTNSVNFCSRPPTASLVIALTLPSLPSISTRIHLRLLLTVSHLSLIPIHSSTNRPTAVWVTAPSLFLLAAQLSPSPSSPGFMPIRSRSTETAPAGTSHLYLGFCTGFSTRLPMLKARLSGGYRNLITRLVFSPPRH